MIIKTTEEILNNPWGEISKKEEFPKRTPAMWLADTALTIDAVKLWEELYYSPGTIGVYASWDPYSEYYIIVHNLHLDKKYIETYSGNDAVDCIIDKCKGYGVSLDVSSIYVKD